MSHPRLGGFDLVFELNSDFIAHNVRSELSRLPMLGTAPFATQLPIPDFGQLSMTVVAVDVSVLPDNLIRAHMPFEDGVLLTGERFLPDVSGSIFLHLPIEILAVPDQPASHRQLAIALTQATVEVELLHGPIDDHRLDQFLSDTLGRSVADLEQRMIAIIQTAVRSSTNLTLLPFTLDPGVSGKLSPLRLRSAALTTVDGAVALCGDMLADGRNGQLAEKTERMATALDDFAIGMRQASFNNIVLFPKLRAKLRDFFDNEGIEGIRISKLENKFETGQTELTIAVTVTEEGLGSVELAIALKIGFVPYQGKLHPQVFVAGEHLNIDVEDWLHVVTLGATYALELLVEELANDALDEAVSGLDLRDAVPAIDIDSSGAGTIHDVMIMPGIFQLGGALIDRRAAPTTSPQFSLQLSQHTSVLRQENVDASYSPALGGLVTDVAAWLADNPDAEVDIPKDRIYPYTLRLFEREVVITATHDVPKGAVYWAVGRARDGVDELNPPAPLVLQPGAGTITLSAHAKFPVPPDAPTACDPVAIEYEISPDARVLTLRNRSMDGNFGLLVYALALNPGGDTAMARAALPITGASADGSFFGKLIVDHVADIAKGFETYRRRGLEPLLRPQDLMNFRFPFDPWDTGPWEDELIHRWEDGLLRKFVASLAWLPPKLGTLRRSQVIGMVVAALGPRLEQARLHEHVDKLLRVSQHAFPTAAALELRMRSQIEAMQAKQELG